MTATTAPRPPDQLEEEADRAFRLTLPAVLGAVVLMVPVGMAPVVQGAGGLPVPGVLRAVLFLDEPAGPRAHEPTSPLGLGHQVEVLELRHEDGMSVLAAMHGLSTAARYADRLALLHRGELVAHGAPATVLDPGLLGMVYGHPVHVHELDGHPVVLPVPCAPRHTRPRRSLSPAAAAAWRPPMTRRSRDRAGPA